MLVAFILCWPAAVQTHESVPVDATSERVVAANHLQAASVSVRVAQPKDTNGRPPFAACTIWLACLPLRPTAHFFDVVGHPRKPHMAQRWPAREFQVCATGARESGYLAVYALLAVCREARLLVVAHYRRAHGASGYEAGAHQEAAPDPFGHFETFDWISADDLVVLCFPPRQATLPHAHALTFARGPPHRVDIVLPSEFLPTETFGQPRDYSKTAAAWADNEVQLPLIPDVLELLGQGQKTPATGGDGDSDAMAAATATAATTGTGGVKAV
jgi:hypothetical protein